MSCKGAKVKYKYFISDFDGTLLRSDNTVSSFTAETISEYIRQGGTFLIATGRMFVGIVERLAEAGLGGLDIPVIAYQGSLIRTAKSGKVLLKRFLDPVIASDIVRFIAGIGVPVQTYYDDMAYCGPDTAFCEQYCKLFGAQFESVNDLPEYVRRRGETVPKVLAYTSKEARDALVTRVAKEFHGRAQITASSGQLVEGISMHSGKDRAIEFLTNQNGDSLNDCIVIGDAMNDITMIKRAGFGAAVANAEKDVLEVADYIAPSNDEDGVAKTILKFCL